MTRWLVTGAAGMLGQDLLARIEASGADVEVTAADRDRLDVTDLAATCELVRGHDVVINCAAWTAVDDAESREAEAFAVNAVGAANLARAAARCGARLLHVSPVYVFAGAAGDIGTPYAEDAAVAPRTAYGRTKAAGEWAIRAELPAQHWILRTAWLYGEHGPNFVRTMARLEHERDTVDVVQDQYGQPTWSRDLADRIIEVLRRQVPFGTYHATSSGTASWYDLARAVFEALGADPSRVVATTSEKFVRPAPRPAWSVLGHQAWAQTGLDPIRDWREALAEAMAASTVAGRPGTFAG